jgi:hypothetical protein
MATALRSIGIAVLLTAAFPAHGGEWGADVNFGYFTGDYGTEEKSDIEIMSPRLRWKFHRGEVDLLRGGGKTPWVSGVLKVKLPTADEEEYLGTGEADFEGGFALVQTVGRTSLLADARYMRVGDPEGFALADVKTLGAGVAQKIGTRRSTYLYAYLENRTHPVPGREDRLDVSLGGSRKFGATNAVKVAGAAYLGLSESAEDFGFSLTVGRAF